MKTAVVGIDKSAEINRKENLYSHRQYWVGRRMQDIILSSLALIVLSPVMLATAIAIVINDPSAGPIFCKNGLVVMENHSSFINSVLCVRMQKPNWRIYSTRMK